MFLSKSIPQNTIGSILREARQSHGWTLKDAEKKTGIAKKYLEYLEADDFYKLPGSTYTKGFLERYAEFLKLNPSKIIERWRKEFSQSPGKEIPNVLGIKNHSQKIFDIKVYLIAAIALLMFFYIGFSIKRVLSASALEILNPPQDLITTDSSIIIAGHVDLGADVFINDQPIKQISEGNFEQEIELLPGLNTIKISAKKKHSKEKIIFRRIILQE
ncbi:helix-turn-helix domain-containing protein [bacterium]|nr:helix-turn-helix domain-containing protein [bacterium]